MIMKKILDTKLDVQTERINIFVYENGTLTALNLLGSNLINLIAILMK